MPMYPRNKGTKSQAWFYSYQRGFVQKPITADSTPYDGGGWAASWSGKEPWSRWGIIPLCYQLGPSMGSQDLAYSRAYDSFTRSIRGGQAAALGITLVQWRQSLDMVSTRTRQIASAANDIRKGNIVRGLKTLNVVKTTRKQRTRFRRIHAKDPSKLWLELQFGWLPLYGDIKTAADVMNRDIPVERKYGTSVTPFEYFVEGNSVIGKYRTRYEGLGVSRYRMGGDVVGINPNVFLAQSMGLTNPAQVAWDAVPFSFVVDWFIPINKYLSAFDARLGFRLQNAFTTHSVKAMSTQKFHYYSSPDGNPPYTQLKTSNSWKILRSTGAGSRPSLASRFPPVDGSLWRAATGVALAVASLSKLRLNLI